MGANVGCARVVRQHRDLQAARGERPQQGVLDAVVDQDRSAPLPTGGGHDVSRSGRDGCHVVDRLPRRAVDGRLDGAAFVRAALVRGVGGRSDHGPSRGAAAQRQRQRAGVDALERRDAGLGQQLFQRQAVAGRWRDQARHHQGAGMDPIRLELGGIDPVVAGHRVGEHHDLALVRRIGQDLAPAGRGRGEDQVALGGDGRTAQGAVKERAVGGGQQSRRRNERRPLGGGWRLGHAAQGLHVRSFPASPGRT